MGHLLTLFAAAILRGLIAGGAGLELETAIAARLPALPHLACGAIGLVAGVVLVEAAAFAFEASRRRIAAGRAAKGE
jgi:hypothetical protein